MKVTGVATLRRFDAPSAFTTSGGTSGPVAVLPAVTIVVRNRIPAGRRDAPELIAGPLWSWRHPDDRAVDSSPPRAVSRCPRPASASEVLHCVVGCRVLGVGEVLAPYGAAFGEREMHP